MRNNGNHNFIARFCSALLVVLLSCLPILSRKQSGQQTVFDAAAKQSYTVNLPLVVRGFTMDNPSVEDWLLYLNNYRAMAGLPPVSENKEWSAGGHFHARYSVKNDILAHYEEQDNPWFTPEGSAAAQSGNLMATADVKASDRDAVDAWMQAPFHAVGILDPSLISVGFGSYREEDGGLQMSATLDILRGLGEIPQAVRYPVMWPTNGATVPIGDHWGEYPDPLTSCAGYRPPSGLPIILQVGAGNRMPVVGAYTFSRGKTLLPSCVFTESTYDHPDRVARDLGRAILDQRDAVILIPRAPLTPGASYSVAIEVDGQLISWTFMMGASIDMSEGSLMDAEIR